MRAARFPVALVAAAAALALSACGDRETPSPRERLGAAVSATGEAGTAAFHMKARIRTGTEAAGTMMTFTSRGGADLRTGASRMETDLPGLGLSVTMLHDGDTVFVRLPGLLTGGEPVWIRQPVDALRQGGVAPGAAATDFAGSPARALEALRDVRGEIERIGSDTVRGSAVEGFAFSVPGERLWRGTGEPPPALRGLEVPATAWLDARGRVRRMTLSMDLAAAVASVREAAGDSLAPRGRELLQALGTDLEGTMELDLELFDFGTAVDTRPPDTARVLDADSAGRRMLGGPLGTGWEPATAPAGGG